MAKKPAALSSSLVAVKGQAAAPPDAQSRHHDPPPVPAEKPAKRVKAGRTGRPVTKEPSKLAPFNLPLRVIEMIEEAADQTTSGNKSLFVQKAVEAYCETLKARE